MNPCELCGQYPCQCDTQEKEICPSCNGSGAYDVGDCEEGVQDICPECGGWGTLYE